MQSLIDIIKLFFKFQNSPVRVKQNETVVDDKLTEIEFYNILELTNNFKGTIDELMSLFLIPKNINNIQSINTISIICSKIYNSNINFKEFLKSANLAEFEEFNILYKNNDFTVMLIAQYFLNIITSYKTTDITRKFKIKTQNKKFLQNTVDSLRDSGNFNSVDEYLIYFKKILNNTDGNNFKRNLIYSLADIFGININFIDTLNFTILNNYLTVDVDLPTNNTDYEKVQRVLIRGLMLNLNNIENNTILKNITITADKLNKYLLDGFMIEIINFIIILKLMVENNITLYNNRKHIYLNSTSFSTLTNNVFGDYFSDYYSKNKMDDNIVKNIHLILKNPILNRYNYNKDNQSSLNAIDGIVFTDDNFGFINYRQLQQDYFNFFLNETPENIDYEVFDLEAKFIEIIRYFKENENISNDDIEFFFILIRDNLYLTLIYILNIENIIPEIIDNVIKTFK